MDVKERDVQTQETLMIDTKALGRVQVDTNVIISFPEGILAFENFTEYALLKTPKNTYFYWLQSTTDKNVAFLLVNPADFLPDYDPKINEKELELIHGKDIELQLFAIVTIPNADPKKMTINLQGPILVNAKEKLGAQFISEYDTYSVQEPLLPLIEQINLNK